MFFEKKIFNKSRFENDAEHAWHLAVMALVLADISNEKIDVSKVIKMVLIHDITYDMLHDKNQHIEDGSKIIWDIAKQIFLEAKEKGAIMESSDKGAN